MGYSGTYRFAEKCFEITTLHQATHMLCAEYASREHAYASVSVSQAEIDDERRRDGLSRGDENASFHPTDAYLETLAVYRKVAELLIADDVILFHGSCVAVNGLGYLFAAVSGTGKSTHTRLWCRKFGDSAVMINDDKPLLKIGADSVIAFGTPWNGKHNLSVNSSVPLKAVCILERSEVNTIERITKKDAYLSLLRQTYRPNDREKTARVLELIDGLAERCALFRLCCNMNAEAADVAYNGMK